MTSNKNADTYLNGMASGSGARIALTTMAMAYVGDQLFVPLLIFGVALMLLSRGLE